MTRPLVRAVFVVLVVATIAAFFTTQQLKGEFPLVIRFATKPAHFSPNGDTYRDTTEVGFDLSEPASVTFMVVDSEGIEVRRIVSERRLAGDAKHRFRWDGRDDDGNLVPDGTYRMRVVRRDESRVIDSAKEISVDRRPPQVTLLSADPSVVATGLPGETPERTAALSRPEEPGTRLPRLSHRRRQAAHRQALPRRPQPRRGVGRPGEHRAWSAPLRRRRATTPSRSPCAIAQATRRRRRGPCREPRVARPRTGVSVRRFTLRGPLSAVTAGAFAHLEVGPVDRSFDWVVSRLGDPKPVLRGGRSAGASASGSRARCARACTWCASAPATTARSGRSPWPACRRAARAAARVRSWCSPRSPGRASTASMTTPMASATGFPSRRPSGSTAPSPTAACRRASPARSRRCCAGSTASGSRTTSPPTWRSLDARARRSGTPLASRSQAASSGCRES